MTSDVSDEALERMAREFTRTLYGINRVASTEALLPLLARIRDLTAARCVALAVDCQRDDGSAGWRCASLYFEKKLLEMFPGAAAAEGEARDG